MPLPKITAPEQVLLQEGTVAKRLVRVVKLEKEGKKPAKNEDSPK